MEGKNIVIEWRFAAGNQDRQRAMAAELAQHKLDVIVAVGTADIRAAKEASATIPIVMVSGGDAVGSGLVASLARPGGNQKSIVRVCLTDKQYKMKPYLIWSIYVFCLLGAVCCEAADSTPIPLTCDMIQSSAVTNQPIEVPAPGFSVLPPRGERWCHRLMGMDGISFFKIPKVKQAFDGPPSLEIAALHLHGGMAMSLKGLVKAFKGYGINVQTPEELKDFVSVLISEHFFSQISAGILSAEHRFRLLESSVAIDNTLAASCVRFEAKIDERGSVHGPGLVLLLNFPGNIVCRHPTASDNDLIWVGFTERYVQGDRPTADALKEEYEPFVQSLRFMPPR